MLNKTDRFYLQGELNRINDWSSSAGKFYKAERYTTPFIEKDVKHGNGIPANYTREGFLQAVAFNHLAGCGLNLKVAAELSKAVPDEVWDAIIELDANQAEIQDAVEFLNREVGGEGAGASESVSREAFIGLGLKGRKAELLGLFQNEDELTPGEFRGYDLVLFLDGRAPGG